MASDLTSNQPLGDATVLVTYRLTPGEPANYSGFNDCPASTPTVEIESVSIKGEFVPASCFAAHQIQSWCIAIGLEYLEECDHA